MSRSGAAGRFSSATTSPTRACSQSCPISADWRFPSAVARRVWSIISTNRATCANGSRALPTTKRDDDELEPVVGREGDESVPASVTLAAIFKFGFCIGTAGFRRRRARIWFHFVERVTRNHIDEWPLTRDWNIRRGPLDLVVVSNRVARGKANEPMTGGLAAALLPVVEKSGAIWVGSSGRVRDGFQKEPFAEVEALGTGALATLDLPAAHYGGYYEGFANSALWPALHSRSDLIRVSHGDYPSYREVNAFMARALMRFRKPDTAFWVQDYHFLLLGAELRELGVTAPIGFFLHTPWPAHSLIEGVPHHRELVEAMLAYDLIGFQTDEDC